MRDKEFYFALFIIVIITYAFIVYFYAQDNMNDQSNCRLIAKLGALNEAPNCQKYFNIH